jgi:MFS family permease
MLSSLFFIHKMSTDRIVRKTESVGQKGSSKPLALIVLFSLFVALTGAGSGTIRAFFAVYLDQHFLLPTYKIGIITAIGQGMAAPAAFLVPLLISRLGKNRGLAAASAGIGLGVAMVAFVPHWVGAGAGYVMAFVSIAIHGVIYNVLQLEIVPEYWRSTMAGTTLLAKGVGWAAISALGGIIIARYGYAPYFAVGVLLPFMGVVLLMTWFRNRRDQ